MLRKKVEIDGREVEFKASAAVPRIYRMKFRRDLFVDLQKIAKSVKKKGKKEDKESSEIPIEDLEMFEFQLTTSRRGRQSFSGNYQNRYKILWLYWGL